MLGNATGAPSMPPKPPSVVMTAGTTLAVASMYTVMAMFILVTAVRFPSVRRCAFNMIILYCAITGLIAAITAIVLSARALGHRPPLLSGTTGCQAAGGLFLGFLWVSILSVGFIYPVMLMIYKVKEGISKAKRLAIFLMILSTCQVFVFLFKERYATSNFCDTAPTTEDVLTTVDDYLLVSALIFPIVLVGFLVYILRETSHNRSDTDERSKQKYDAVVGSVGHLVIYVVGCVAAFVYAVVRQPNHVWMLRLGFFLLQCCQMLYFIKTRRLIEKWTVSRRKRQALKRQLQDDGHGGESHYLRAEVHDPTIASSVISDILNDFNEHPPLMKGSSFMSPRIVATGINSGMQPVPLTAK